MPPFASTFSSPHREGLPIPFFFLVVLLAVMFGGAFPIIFFIASQNVVWLVWGFAWVLILALWFKIPFARLLIPMAPFLLWLLGYICWSMMAATYPALTSGYRLAFRFLTIAAGIAIVTSGPRRFRFFVNTAQWVLLLNLGITFLLMNYPEYQASPAFSHLNVDAYSDRFAGLWGDANVAGLVSLLILVLSYWATPWVAWIGRFSGLMIIYLTASRTAVLILAALGIFYFFFQADRWARLKILGVAALLVTGTLFYAGLKNVDLVKVAEDNPVIARVTDITESKTRDEGQDSRVDLMKRWISLASIEPWYGYGLYSLEGDSSDETHVKRGFPSAGTHNLYIGLFIDAGILGLLSFLAVVGYQLFKIYRAPLSVPTRKVLLCLCFVTLVFATANHQLIMDFPGWIAFALIFILPFSPALQSQDA